MRLERRETASPRADLKVYEVFFDSWDSTRIGAWLVVPPHVERGFVVGHGYGGREQPGFDLPAPDAAALFPCAPGFGLSGRADLPANAQQHVVHGIRNRDTYILRACVASLWTSASELLELCPEIGSELYYAGGSFGGGLGALALPWDGRYRKGSLAVPTFGQHSIRVQCPCEGSGKAVRDLYLQHPEVMDVLQYYDAATAARWMRSPALVAPALFDPVVPPPGQFAIYNGLAGERELFVLQAGHFRYPGQPGEQQRLREATARFFAA
jgi:cephalosporin-C deacetylase